MFQSREEEEISGGAQLSLSRTVSKTGAGAVQPESVWSQSRSVSNVSISLADEQQVNVINS